MKPGKRPDFEMSERPGFRMAKTLIEFSEGSSIIERWIPCDELYPQEIVRLSGKITQDSIYSIPTWNDELNTVVKVRETIKELNMVQFNYREFHDAEEGLEDSLLHIELAVRRPAMNMNGITICPLEILSYIPQSHDLYRFELPTYGGDLTEEALKATYDLLYLTQETQATERDWMILYETMLVGAGEK